MTLCCKIKNFYYATALDYDTACTLNSARLACIGNWYENLSNTCQLQNTTWFTPNWHSQVSLCSKGSGKEAGYEGPPHVGEEWTICGGPHHPPRLLSPFRKHSMSQWAFDPWKYILFYWIDEILPPHLCTKCVSSHLWTVPRQIKFWAILIKSWDWRDPPPPSLGQNPKFTQKKVWTAPLMRSWPQLFVISIFWCFQEVPHQPTDCNCTDRVGRQHTELPFFSFMAEWEKERGQWFQRALVGSQLYSFNCTAMLPFHNTCE